MPTYYFDWDNGNDVNPGTQLLPKRSYQVAALASLLLWGDVVYIKRGTTQIVSSPFLNLLSNLRMYAYGEGPRPRWVASGAALGTAIFNASQNTNILVEDQDFDATGVPRTIYCAAQGANSVTNLTFRRCWFHNASSNGIEVNQESTATAQPSGFLFEDCEFFDNGAHGSIVMGVNHTFRRCKAYRNGATVLTGGHGFSARAARTSVTGGWTLTSGTIYQRTLAAVETNVFAVADLSGFGSLSQNTSTPTSPSSGQFGQSGTTLYVNIGVNPAGRLIAYGWGRCTGLSYEFCEASDTIWVQGATFTEGHGFAADDFVSNSKYVGCVSRNNEGFGFTLNRGANNVISGCVVIGNGMGGLLATAAPNSAIRNNTFVNNNAGARTPGSVDVQFTEALSTSCVVANNIVVGTRTTGIEFNATAGGTATTNAVFGYQNAVSNGTPTGTITTDPRPHLASDYSLRVAPSTTLATLAANNPLALAGTYIQGVTLRNGRMRPGYCPVGAYQAVLPRAARA